MALTVLITGVDDQNIHARTTGGSEKSQAVVLGIDGSNSVIPADETLGLGVNVLALPGTAIAGMNQLPAGPNNIGAVNVADLIPGTGPTKLGKAEDAAHASGDTGVMMLFVRSDTFANKVTTDNDYAPGQVDANGLIGVNVGSIAAAAHTTDTIGNAAMTGGLIEMVAGVPTLRAYEHAIIDENTSGDQEIVAAAASLKILPISYDIVVAGAVTLRWKSATTNKSGARSLAANGGWVKGWNPGGHFKCGTNEPLNLNLSASVQVSGELTYVKVAA